jgi:hypothetical protein
VGGDLVTITRACYCNRATAMRAVDFKDGIDQNDAADRAIETASTNIDRQLHRVFYPRDTTYWFDWPNQGGSGGGQYAMPWRLWLDQYDCIVLTAMVTGGVTIPLNQVFLEPVNAITDGRPGEYIELDRSSTAAFGGNSVTPQHSIALTGTWGYTAAADTAGTLAAAVTTTGQATVTVSDGSQAGPGDLLILGYGQGAAPYPAAAGYAGALAPYTGERVLVTAAAAADTGLAISTGIETASASDQALTTSGSGTLNVGEVLTVDSEQMLIEMIVGSVTTVRRAWNGTTLATHSASAEIYAQRLLTVARGMYGTTAATYSNGAAVYRQRIPSLIRDLAIAETVNQILQEGSGYARMVGSGADAHPAPGADLASKWEEAMVAHGRKARTRAV